MNGRLFAGIYAGKMEFKGKPVKVRGKVVKYNTQIMGKNWIHIQDGTGIAGSNDRTVTTAAKTKVGDTILATGAVATDRDFASDPDQSRNRIGLWDAAGGQGAGDQTHQHWQPFGVLTWSVSTDGGFTWRTTDRAPDVGRVLDCSYGEPLRDERNGSRQGGARRRVG